MGTTTHLGEFELLVLLAVMQRRGDAYGVTIAEELEDRSGRSTSRGALYITLKRLAEKGYLASRMGRPQDERGGRRRRYYEVTPDGVAVARNTRRHAVHLGWARNRVGGHSRG